VPVISALDSKMRIVIFALSLICGLFPAASYATEGITCSNADYTFDFVVNTEATSIAAVSVYIKGAPQNLEDWEVRKKRIVFQDRQIEIAVEAPGKMPSLHLRTENKKGLLHIGNRAVEITCDCTNWVDGD
jgi:hypothetical protein